MGKRKIEKFEEIQNKVSKYVTYCKRKKGVIKKAMELSLLCGQEVMMAIFDKKKKKLVIYQSTQEFDPKEVNRLLSIPDTKTRLYEEHTNKDFNGVGEQKPQTFDLRHDFTINLPRSQSGKALSLDANEDQILNKIDNFGDDHLDLEPKLKYQKLEQNQDDASVDSDNHSKLNEV